MYISTNKFQTQLTDELLASLNPEVKDDLLDMITNVEYVKRLISPDRRYAKDMPRSKNSKIIVDLCNPHILEHMEYFTQSADHFRKFGCYTKLMPNPNPQSEFGQ